MASSNGGAPSPGPRRRPDQTPPAGPRDRYGSVLLLLVGSYLLSAFLANEIVPIAVYTVALLIALRTSGPPGRRGRWLRWMLLLGSVAAAAATIVTTRPLVHGLAAVWLAGILLATIVVVVRRVLRHHVVTAQTIFGALSAYLLIGFLFVALFAALAHLDTEPLFADGRPAAADTIQYFSFVTLTTTGYGDYTAASTAGRALAVLEALSGQLFLVTLLARLVSLFGTAPRRKL